MALTSGPEILPNLKIQVENELLDEAMEVDEDRNERKKDEASGNVDSELEEGEISDSKDDDDPPTSHAFKSSLRDLPELPDFERRYENKSGAFVTGIDIFSKDGQEKLNVRAKRFGLDPSEAKPLTSVQLHELYERYTAKPKQAY